MYVCVRDKCLILLTASKNSKKVDDVDVVDFIFIHSPPDEKP